MINSYQEGTEAFKSGKARSDNPYPFGTYAEIDWDNGWLDAERYLNF